MQGLCTILYTVSRDRRYRCLRMPICKHTYLQLLPRLRSEWPSAKALCVSQILSLHAQQREHGTSDSNISGLRNMETMYDVFCDGNSEKAYSVAKYVAGPSLLTADEPWLRRHSSDLFCDAICVTGKKVVCVCHSSKQASGLLLAVERRPIFFPVD